MRPETVSNLWGVVKRSSSMPLSRLSVSATSVLGFAALTALTAQVRMPVPNSDVPYTLQSLAVLLTGFVLSPIAATSAMLVYLACGAVGLPVFMPGSSGLLGATGGYLAGFVFAALTISLIRRNQATTTSRLALAGFAGLCVLFICGLVWRYFYAMIFGLDAGSLLAAGVVPFIPKAIVELLLAVSFTRVWNQYRTLGAS